MSQTPAKTPTKPYKDFPLFPHATGRWAKKILGKTVYFGPWRDPQGALTRYLEQRDDLYAGRVPHVRQGTATIQTLLNAFLESKDALLSTKELTPASFYNYHQTCKRIASHFGIGREIASIGANDLRRFRESLPRSWAPYTTAVEIGRVRTVFKFAFDEGLVSVPLRLANLRPPSRAVVRKARAAKRMRMFEPHEVWKLLDAATPAMKAMILLGLNCGFGNSDLARLPVSAISPGWVDFPRPKTGIARRSPLWEETEEAVRAVAGEPLVFYTRRHTPLTGKRVVEQFDRFTQRVGVLGRGFYALRHTTATVGGSDQVALDLIMGHARHDMASVYREKVSDERLLAVTRQIREWLGRPPQIQTA